jgi:hypothetical protein
MFATDIHNTGTVIHRSFTKGVLFDMTGTTEASVQFDINKGWLCGGSPVCTDIQFDEDLLPILIVQSQRA